MTSSSTPRHLLVIAPQCQDLGPLDGLEDVADSLHAALLERWVGDCEEPPPGIPSLLSGPDVMQTQVEKAVRDAAERAGEARAVLVLAFLGHGTTLGDVPRLSFMASDSRQDTPTTVVNLGDLLTQALDTPGVEGVVAVVDTCRAGGAAPDLAPHGAGVRQGVTRLSLLMSVGVTEDAHGLAFSRGLVQVLRDGVPGAGEFLSADVVCDTVNAAVHTAARFVVADGASIGPRPWLARNTRHRPGGGPLLGPLGEEELRWALEPLGETVPPGPWGTVADLERIRPALRGPAAHPHALAYAARVLDRLSDTVRTTDLLRSWPGAPLTSDRLRRAFRAAAGSAAPRSSGGELLRDCVEFLRLRAPRTGTGSLAPLAAFVAALATEDGLDRTTPRLSAWATALDAGVELNDAFAAQALRTAEGRLRLVISLHAAVADDWPETLQVWLLDRNTSLAHEEFDCSPTQSGVEDRFVAVLRWATRQARCTGAQLKRVDIAAPAPLLARWRPEETRLGTRLGVRYDIVLRWSERLYPQAHLGWINDLARERLAAMKSDSGAPLDWLDEEATGRAEELTAKLEDGWYERALALSHRPDRLEEVLEPLLAFAPIVLWPHAPGSLPPDSRAGVERHWDRLPGEFSAAYRTAWRQGGERDGAPEGHCDLALLRSVWLDEEWLDFCDWFDNDVADGESTV
ncbi:hypothetical protein [Streptomyces sp. YU58]|uniref:vWA-MoxR associated conflict system protein n=1 Tax=Streptomyces sp. SX92 TaxID=3158972 RepID=UPI0027BB0D35|nr:hypothetical protein [Streptomyces coralus]WLW50522.1 hypothetical protein QU709_03730 [Streptomyces coralus]